MEGHGRCVVHPRARRPRFSPRAALVAVEIEAATGGDLESGDAALSAMSKGGPHYLLYVGEEPREALLAAVESAGWPEGDAVCGPGGLFQKGYVTPDPLWAKKCWGAWDPAPARWVVSKFFGERMVEKVGSGAAASLDGGELFEEEEMEVLFEVAEGGGELMTVRDDLDAKLREMGVAGSVGLRGGSGSGGSVVVRPSGAPPGEVVRFCAEMLQKQGEEVFVFGSGSFVDASQAAVGDGARGAVPRGEAAGKGVFKASSEGGEAFLEGLQYFGFLVAGDDGPRA